MKSKRFHVFRSRRGLRLLVMDRDVVGGWKWLFDLCCLFFGLRVAVRFLLSFFWSERLRRVVCGLTEHATCCSRSILFALDDWFF